MARRRSTSSNGKNRFQGRGMDKFQQVYAELETKRVEIAAREGVPTTDVWFMRDTNEHKEDWVPVVVRKKTKHHGSSRLQLDNQQQPPETINQQQEGQSSAAGSSSSWVRMKLEQIAADMQQAARRALKSISLFIMVVAAVFNLVVAVVAELASSLLSLVAGPEEQVPRSNPNPNLVSLTPPLSPSPPSTPRIRPSSGSSSRTSSRPTSPRAVRTPPRKPAAAAPMRSSAMPFLVTVVVILLSMEIGRVQSVLLASVSWFTFPVLKAMFTAGSRR